MPSPKKRKHRKSIVKAIWPVGSRKKSPWQVKFGRLVPSVGPPNRDQPSFEIVAEKLPYASLSEIKKDLKARGYSRDGVYMAHDSMGTPRYIGRGRIFSRLATRRKQHPNELQYFSFYVVKNKVHERELETVLIRAAGLSLNFNEKKKRTDLSHGSVKDYEAGTAFYERQKSPGRKKSRKRKG